MRRIHMGFFEITNPYNRKKSIIETVPESVHSIVLWSKNFGPFIEGDYADKLEAMGYHLFFNFTINSPSKILEPHVPPLSARLEQLKYLCRRFEPESINWRFDPICFFRLGNHAVMDNLSDFARIATSAACSGITRCITSFVDLYAKIQRRTRTVRPELVFMDPPLEKKLNILLQMENLLSALDIRLQTCCEIELIKHLPKNSTITGASCVPNHLLAKLFGGSPSQRKDSGQRRRQGCGCRQSVDIGHYERHPCYHNCLFCYANPVESK